MMISFAWTTPAFLAKEKSCTRRDWYDDYADRFRIGSEHVAMNRQAKYGGVPIGTIGILDVYKQSTAFIPETDWKAEGFEYLTKIGARCGKRTAQEIWDEWHMAPCELYVVRFTILSVKKPDRAAGSLSLFPEQGQ